VDVDLFTLRTTDRRDEGRIPVSDDRWPLAGVGGKPVLAAVYCLPSVGPRASGGFA
jgi:hypothetical protein